jgi:hypothetical protein
MSPQMSSLLNHIIRCKEEGEDKLHEYSVTPRADDPGWDDAVEDGRGHGIPIASFGDTMDKVVLHPGHLGYKFDYFWGRGHWSSESCWDKEASERDVVKSNKALWRIAHELRELKYFVWIVLPSGNDKGYLSTRVLESSEWMKFTSLDELMDEFQRTDVVLFVFGDLPDYQPRDNEKSASIARLLTSRDLDQKDGYHTCPGGCGKKVATKDRIVCIRCCNMADWERHHNDKIDLDFVNRRHRALLYE